MSSLPLADYALLSDCHSAALVSRGGSVDWLCFPRFDKPSVFGRLLDDSAGHWSIHPTADVTVSRRYIDETMALETAFETASGSAVLIDAMALGRNERGHRLGFRSPGLLMRRVMCRRGSVEFELEYAPRPEYGLISPLLIPVRGGLLARGGSDVLLLSTPVPLQVDGASARARFSLRDGQHVSFAIQHRSTADSMPRVWTDTTIEDRLEDTLQAWRTWSALHQRYDGSWRELVHHSGRVLQSLTYQPTGAIVAAPTTSLPEDVGGVRNWDYRYTWVRDASLTLDALWIAACPDEARHFFSWMVAAVASQLSLGKDLQIMFGVGGERDLSERNLDHLAGWRDSRPVRIGNGAWNQRQLDVYGELLRAVHRLADQLGRLNRVTRQFLVAAADAAAARWQEPDQGIWEVRGEPRHYLHSKLMCWAALDSAIALTDRLHARSRVADWTSAREKIREAILEHAWSENAGAFAQSFGSDDLDGSALMIPIVGFLPLNDRRVRATVDAIADRLTDERGLVYRYRSHDGLAGGEGTFLLCTFWLAEALALVGEVDRARATFERAAAYANDVGLLSEEADPERGELLGNFPQAFSHIGLVNAAWAISEAERRSPTSRSAQT
jgi:GH15 family glucan-1,4-alpha-glucosidase